MSVGLSSLFMAGSSTLFNSTTGAVVDAIHAVRFFLLDKPIEKLESRLVITLATAADEANQDGIVASKASTYDILDNQVLLLQQSAVAEIEKSLV